MIKRGWGEGDNASRIRTRPLLVWFAIVMTLQISLLAVAPQGVWAISQLLQVGGVIFLLLAMVQWRTPLSPQAELFLKAAVGVATLSASLLLVRLLGPGSSLVVESLTDSLFYFGLCATAVFVVSGVVSAFRR